MQNFNKQEFKDMQQLIVKCVSNKLIKEYPLKNCSTWLLRISQEAMLEQHIHYEKDSLEPNIGKSWDDEVCNLNIDLAKHYAKRMIWC